MIKDTLKANRLTAMKAGNTKEVETIQYILAQIQNKEIEKRGELSEEEVVTILRRIIKEIKDSLIAAEKGNRTAVQAQYTEELNLITPYLPSEMSDEDLKKEIRQIIKNNQELYQKNPQAVTGICVKELRSKADPGRIVGILRSL